MSSDQPPDAEVMFELTGRSRVLTGYRPQYVIMPGYNTSVMHRFVDAEIVSGGDRVKAEVWFVSPEAYPHTLWEGRKIDIAEGAEVVGSATILRVINPLLRNPHGAARA